MRISSFPAISMAPLMAAALTGCAEQGRFPSLLPRAIEQADAGPPPSASAPALPADPGLATEIAGIIARARQGQAAFEAALAATRAAVARAGAAESESWIEGQQALSRLEAARAPTMTALGDLDALAARLAKSPTATEADRAAVSAASEEVGALANAQREEINRLGTRL